MKKEIQKVLTPNDTGETGAHQAGLLIPKESEILSFFPSLDPETKNPRATIQFTDESGDNWEFRFIYYNNKFFGGTRNEYRLTCMTKYLRIKNLKQKDLLIFTRGDFGGYRVNYQKASEQRTVNGAIKLSGTWKIIKKR